MKKISLITLLTLLSTGLGLHAGCWMPESDTVKNHYKGIDGGYVKVRGKDKVTGEVDPKSYYIRLRGKIRVVGRFGRALVKGVMKIYTVGLGVQVKTYYKLFIPRGFRMKAHQATKVYVFNEQSRVAPFHDKDIENLAKKYWPHLTDISLGFTESRDFPCYINSTQQAFEKFKKEKRFSKAERKETKHQLRQEVKEARRSARQKKKEEKKIQRQQQ